MKIIRFAELAPKPWKNGGGTTTEIAASPQGAGFDDFDWRLSVADVGSDGPFSLFPQIDRTLTVIEGNGLAMSIDGRKPVILTPASAPLSFPGNVPVNAMLVDGAIRDFNVMTRRGRYSHKVTKHDLRAGSVHLPEGGTRLIVALESGQFQIGRERMEAGFADLIEVETAGPAILSGSTTVLILQIQEI